MITLQKVSKSYNKKLVLENIDLQIHKGQTIAIVGKSGKGKSTLLNIIGLIEKATSGVLKIDNKIIKSTNSRVARDYRAFKLDYLFQNFALVDDETIEENILLGMKRKKLKKQEKRQVIANVLEKVGLKDREKEKVFNLSGGEQQRVAIARLLARDNDIILADEPTGSLDEETKHEILKALEVFKNDSKKTLIIVTHDKIVADWCDEIIEL